ncbi:MAG: hypothetical protein JXB44_05825 [Calditrichaceae bacterium]|nr:hypothetical protein [Calditrichaceae bacterium]RQV95865.1 MAG: hypothetical protein EH224_06295 [Calditrichota bacterium]
MSWTAESVNACFKKEELFKKFKCWCFANEQDFENIPKISKIIGINKFLKLAAKHKLTSYYNRFLSWKTSSILLVLIIAGFLKTFIESFIKTNFQFTSFEQIFINPSFLLLSVYLTVIGLLVKFILAFLTKKTRAKSIEELRKKIDIIDDNVENKKLHTSYIVFINDLAKHLGKRNFPRCIIIDNYESLDFTTKSVIYRYFKKYSNNSCGSEIWVIFDGEDGELFSTKILENKASFGYYNSQILHLRTLNKEERLALAKSIGKPDRAEFECVKSICKVSDNIEFSDFFKAYRIDHPKAPAHYGDLEFLFLLSLNSEPSVNFLNIKSVINEFSIKPGSKNSVLRNEISRQFLYGTKNAVDEFRIRISNIEAKFKPYIRKQNGTNFYVIKDTAETLTRNAASLSLPNTKLGHLFWANYFYDKLVKYRIEASWIRKLTYHLLESDLTQIENEELYKKLLIKHYQILLFTINGCIQASLYRDLIDLLGIAYLFLQEEDLKNNYIYKKNLLKECWKAYSILGSEKIMEMIIPLHSQLSLMDQAKIHEPMHPLEHIFFDLIPLSSVERNLLKLNFFQSSLGNKDIIKSISDFIKIRSIWASFELKNFINDDYQGFKFRQAYIEGEKILKELFDDVYNRLINKENSIAIIDTITLSLCIWCFALKLKPLVNIKPDMNISYHNQQLFKNDENLVKEIKKIFYDSNYKKYYDIFETLIVMVESTILIAEELKREGDGEFHNIKGINFPLSVLSHELCAISLTTIVLGYHYLSISKMITVDIKTFNKINSILKACNDTFELRLPDISDLNIFLSQNITDIIDGFLNITRILWKKLSLDNAHDYLNFRRIYFKYFISDPKDDDYEFFNKLIQSIGTTINDDTYNGFHANLLVSSILKSYGELKAYYLNKATITVLKNDFGESLKNELCYLCILDSSTYNYNLTNFLEHLLASGNLKESFLWNMFKYVPERKLAAYLLPLLNVSSRKGCSLYHSQLKKIISEFILELKNDTAKTELEALLEYFTIKEKESNIGSVNPDDIIDKWQNKRNYWMYASICDNLINAHPGHQNLLEESLQLLKRDPYHDTYSSYFLLAISVMNQLSLKKNKLNDIEIPLSYIRSSIEFWSKYNTVETNINAYEILYHYDELSTKEYLYEIQKWKIVQLERDHLKKLPELIKQGRYFNVFYDYFDTMQYWGLKTDIDSKELYDIIKTNRNKEADSIKSFKTIDFLSLHPILKKNGNVLISSQFLIACLIIFNPPNDQNPLYDEDRNRINTLAYDNLKYLYEMIINLPQLPGSIRNILKDHSDRLFVKTLV